MSLEAITSNIEKAKNAAKNGQTGYYRNASLEKYDNFMPSQFGLIEQMIKESICVNGKCRILEIGCGTGDAAKELKEIFGNEIEYEALDVVEPENQKGIDRWIESDIDSFIPDKKYDLIYSVNGLIYGYDDKSNLIKLANALNEGGELTFNYDGCTDPLGTKKKTRFSLFLFGQFFDSLYNKNFHCCAENFSGRKIFYGKRKNQNDLNLDDVEKTANNFNEQKIISYVPSFGEKQKWINLNDPNGDEKIQKDILKEIERTESFFKYHSKNRFEANQRESFISWANEGIYELLITKIPIRRQISNKLDYHPLNKRH